MDENLRDLTPLKRKLLHLFKEEASEWNSRKQDAPSPNDENDYWWESKAKWSMCLDAVSLIEECEPAGILEDYIAQLRKAFADHNWGFMENWGSGPHYEAKRLITNLLEKTLADSDKILSEPSPPIPKNVDDKAAREKKVQGIIDLMVKKRKEAQESGELDRLGLG